ncbi:MAG: ribonuclease HI [Rhodospirillaceae bacterium]|nr:ribonuclease HI [Rhodospirillaceae bacterium]OUT77948.1 MAG: ribonuclease HI [Rhodospirillaceae bacterium TMED23]|tara:strand:- start:58 stop:501 length:444 start_codon:yes stop_codon:yes gene_type:complete
MNVTNTVEIYSDGACSGNPGPGGWGVLLRWNSIEKELFGGEQNTTNNRMEVQAVIEGLKALKKPSFVIVYTDSTYVQKTMTQWLEGWKIQGYKIKGGKYRINHDLWRELDALSQKHTIDWCWVRGHDGHPENERADALARKGVDLVR